MSGSNKQLYVVCITSFGEQDGRHNIVRDFFTDNTVA